MNRPLSASEREFLATGTLILEAMHRNARRRVFQSLYPEEDQTLPDGTIAYSRHKYPKHMEFFEAGAEYRERCAMAANRVGKALRDGTPVATPAGWRAIETLRPGDKVFAGDGTETVVTGVYPQGVKPLHRMVFDGEYTVDCCAEHLWVFQHPKARYPYRWSHGKQEANPFFGEWSVADTASIIAAVGCEPITRMRVVMPTTKPWQMAPRALPLDPYLLGCLIGDGLMAEEMVAFSTADAEMVTSVANLIPVGMAIKKIGYCGYRLVKGAGKRNPVMTALKQLGLHGLKSQFKFVPQDYLLSSIEDRVAMLQGLMDTDGSISSSGAMEFSSTSRRLIDDVVFLVTSLGGRASVEARQTYCNGKAGLPSWRARIRLNICPFRLARKADRWNPRHNTENRILHRIESAEPGYATCISVAHPDHTYVTAHGIVTHNSYGMGGYETVAHLTGLYPDWWVGRRFAKPIKAWAAGKTNETTRDIVQLILMGEPQMQGGRRMFDGTGLIPGNLIGSHTFKAGLPDLIDTVKIRHVSGGWSQLGFKSYQQGRGAFEGTERHVIWLDEEPPADVYGECLIRTATVNGLVLLTFTPLEGLSEVVLSFLPQEMRPDAPNPEEETS